jgi:hypothetical protein
VRDPVVERAHRQHVHCIDEWMDFHA